jgi:hypothetical protein
VAKCLNCLVAASVISSRSQEARATRLALGDLRVDLLQPALDLLDPGQDRGRGVPVAFSTISRSGRLSSEGALLPRAGTVSGSCAWALLDLLDREPDGLGEPPG